MYQNYRSYLAAELGFEPRQTESESVVLTVTLFGNIFGTQIIVTEKADFVKRKIKIFPTFQKLCKNS